MLGIHRQVLTYGRAECADLESSLHIADSFSHLCQSVTLYFESPRERLRLRIFWTFESVIKRSNSKPIFLETDQISSEVRNTLKDAIFAVTGITISGRVFIQSKLYPRKFSECPDTFLLSLQKRSLTKTHSPLAVTQKLCSK